VILQNHITNEMSFDSCLNVRTYAVEIMKNDAIVNLFSYDVAIDGKVMQSRVTL